MEEKYNVYINRGSGDRTMRQDIADDIDNDSWGEKPQEVAASELNEGLSAGWQPIGTAPKDGRHIRLYKPEIQFVGYWATGCEKWIINAPDLPEMTPPPTHWKELDWPEGR